MYLLKNDKDSRVRAWSAIALGNISTKAEQKDKSRISFELKQTIESDEEDLVRISAYISLTKIEEKIVDYQFDEALVKKIHEDLISERELFALTPKIGWWKRQKPIIRDLIKGVIGALLGAIIGGAVGLIL